MHTHARCFAEGRTSKTLLATSLSPDCFSYEHRPALLTSVLCRVPRQAPITSNPSDQTKTSVLPVSRVFFVSALVSRLLTLAFFWSSAPLVIWCLGVKSLKLLEVPKPCSAIPFCNTVHSQFHRESPRDHGSARESPGEPGQAWESPGELGKGQ